MSGNRATLLKALTFKNQFFESTSACAAPGFLAFILWGVGAFVGTMLAGWVMARNKLPEAVGTIEHDWQASGCSLPSAPPRC